MRCPTGKQPFGTRKSAHRKIICNYIFHKDAFGMYECPHCLDFHLTSKYDNRSRTLRALCRTARRKYFMVLTSLRVNPKYADENIYKRALTAALKKVLVP